MVVSGDVDFGDSGGNFTGSDDVDFDFGVVDSSDVSDVNFGSSGNDFFFCRYCKYNNVCVGYNAGGDSDSCSGSHCCDCDVICKYDDSVVVFSDICNDFNCCSDAIVVVIDIGNICVYDYCNFNLDDGWCGDCFDNNVSGDGNVGSNCNNCDYSYFGVFGDVVL